MLQFHYFTVRNKRNVNLIVFYQTLPFSLFQVLRHLRTSIFPRHHESQLKFLYSLENGEAIFAPNTYNCKE